MNRNHKIISAVLLIVLLTFTAYMPSLINPFNDLDDPYHITDNPLIKELSWANISQCFQQSIERTYIPVTLISFMMDYHFFGLNPFIFHLNNLLLHLALTVLIFFFLLKNNIKLRPALLASLIFGLHPLHVESVAWITARKDILYSLFYVLALFQYYDYVHQNKRSAYGICLLLALLSILSKSMALSFPLILFVFDWFWKRKKSARLLVEKIPFMLILWPIAWQTYILNSRVVDIRFPDSVLIWIWSFMFYIFKFLWPRGLLVIYSLPRPVGLDQWPFLFAVIGFIVLLGGLWFGRRQRLILFAFGYFFLSVFFLLRMDDNVFDITFVANRYMYLPSLGFCLLGGVGLDRCLTWTKNWSVLAHSLCRVMLPCFFLLLSILTFSECTIWGNAWTMWAPVIQDHPQVELSWRITAKYFLARKQFRRALYFANKAAALDPNDYYALNIRGLIFVELGMYEEAVKEFKAALTINPDFKDAQRHLKLTTRMIKP